MAVVEELRNKIDALDLKIKDFEKEKTVKEEQKLKEIQALESKLSDIEIEGDLTTLKREKEERDAKINRLESEEKENKEQIELQKENISDLEKKIASEIDTIIKEAGIDEKIDQARTHFDEEVDSLRLLIKEQKSEGLFIKNKLEDIENKMKKLQDDDNETNKKLKEYMAKTDELTKTRNIIKIGQFCAEVTEAIYETILPDYFKDEYNQPKNNYPQPHLDDIKANITTYHSTEKNQQQALDEWEKIRVVMGHGLVEYMEKAMRDRNEKAHPRVDMKKLIAISKLEDQKDQYLERLIDFTQQEYPQLLKHL